MSPTMEEKISFFEKKIKVYQDFPIKGVFFRDLFVALADGRACRTLQEVLVDYIRKNFPTIEAVVGLESRGFLFSFSVAAELEIGCIPIRKKGKLPGNVISRSYQLEYGKDVFEIQRDPITKPGLKCLVIDDLIATGGTMEAAVNLLKQCNYNVIGCLAIIELIDMKGYEKVSVPVHALIKHDTAHSGKRILPTLR